MYAIVETGGKQYRVNQGDEFQVERLKADEGELIELDKVLLVSDGEEVEVGKPYIAKSSVTCEVLSHFRGKKLIAFKYRRRKSSKSKIGHRQNLTRLKVKEIKYKSQ